MYFISSKVLWFFAGPINVLVFGVALGAALSFTRFARAGRTLVVVAAVGLLVAGYSPLSNALILPLEQQFPHYRDDGGPVAGVIVLGGAVEQRPSIARGQLTLNDSAERIIAMADLARRGRKVPRLTPIATHEYPTRAARPADGRLDCSRIGRLHGIAPTDWRVSLSRALDKLLA